MEGSYSVSGDRGLITYLSAIVINGYGGDLDQKFQRVFPVTKVTGFTSFTVVRFYYDNGDIYLLSDNDGTNFHTLYGQLDLNTGKWVKPQKLEKGKIDSTDSVQEYNLWYKDSFIAIYQSLTRFLNSTVDISLKVNLY